MELNDGSSSIIDLTVWLVAFLSPNNQELRRVFQVIGVCLVELAIVMLSLSWLIFFVLVMKLSSLGISL